MAEKDLRKFTGDETITVSGTMQKINQNGYGILFLADRCGKLLGSITDGDIRRYLLSGGKMESPAIHSANRHPKVATSFEEAKDLYDQRNFVAIPILNDDGVIIDLYLGESGTPKAKRHNPINCPVVINAGGKGTRLDPFTRVLPKPLIPVGELPIIEHIIKEYKSYNCNDFHIIVNYKKSLMKAYFADRKQDYAISWYDEERPLGTGGGLSLLRGKIKDTFFFANCDVLLTENYEDMMNFHKKNGNVITMICAYKNMSVPYGVVEMGVNGIIQEFREKPQMSFLTNTGIYIVEPEVIDNIEDGVPIGFPSIVEKERKKGKRVAAFPVSENAWMDMGQLPELEKMRAKLYGE